MESTDGAYVQEAQQLIQDRNQARNQAREVQDTIPDTPEDPALSEVQPRGIYTGAPTLQ